MSTSMAFLFLVLACGASAEIRTWTLDTGMQMDAEYEKVVMDKVWMRNSAGENVKIPLSRFSENDRLYIELLNPPTFDIEFKSKEDHLLGYYKGTPHLSGALPPNVSQCSFTAVVRKQGSGEYHHQLSVTYHAIGRQRLDRDKYILLERKSGRFIPSESPELALSGGKVRLLNYVFGNANRGREFAHYLVVVTDERGELIAHKESAAWLFEHLEALDKLPVGAIMNDRCERVYPTGPKPDY